MAPETNKIRAPRLAGHTYRVRTHPRSPAEIRHYPAHQISVGTSRCPGVRPFRPVNRNLRGGRNGKGRPATAQAEMGGIPVIERPSLCSPLSRIGIMCDYNYARAV